MAAADTKPDRDFLLHLEAFLARRDGVDKLLKISRYAAKLLLACPPALLPASSHPLLPNLKSFESSVGLSRKAFRLGKFVQDINSLKSTSPSSGSHLLLSLIAYGGEGVYYFVEQLVWLTKTGLIGPTRAKTYQSISAWAEFIGYLGSIALKIRELDRLREEEMCLVTRMEVGEVRGEKVDEELGKVREKKVMKWLSTVQDVADWMMALADIREGRGRLSQPGVVAAAGMVSALISTHKNWKAC